MISNRMARVLGLLIVMCLTEVAASSQVLNIRLQYGEKALVLNDSSLRRNKQPILITQLRFYISGITLLNGDSTVWTESNSYHLIDASLPKSQRFDLGVPDGLEYNALLFNIGVDSATSCSGAMGGDLDPTKGMFWSWNSGYINFKLEGTYPACPTRNHKFEFHLGGYQYPYGTLQQIKVAASPGSPMEAVFDISQFINGLDLAQDYRVMSPGKAAQDLSITNAKTCTNALAK